MSVTVTERIQDEPVVREDYRGREYTREFHVYYVDSHASALNAIDADSGLSIPPVGARYLGVDDFAFCKSREARRHADNKQYYTVAVVYSTYAEGGDPQPTEPWLRDPDLVFSGVTTQEPMDEDVNGTYVRNSAGEPFDPPVMRDVTRFALTYTRNHSRFFPSLAQDYTDAVNSTSFLQIQPGHVKMGAIGASYVTEVGYKYWRVQYPMHFNFTEHGFEPPIMDRGFQQLVYVDEPRKYSEWGDTYYLTVPKRVHITVPIIDYRRDATGAILYNDDGTPKTHVVDIATTTVPVPLDGEGAALQPDENGVYPDPQPIPNEIQRYKKMDFGRLGIEDDIWRRLTGS